MLTSPSAHSEAADHCVLRRLAACALLTLVLDGPSSTFGQGFDQLVAPPPEAWLQHGGTPDAQRYSGLDEINRDNVASLRLLWSAELGYRGRVQGSPAVVGDTLIVSIPDGLLALDATSGETRWRYNAQGQFGHPGAVVVPSRAPRGSPVIQGGRAYTVLREPVVVAVDIESGQEVWRRDVSIEGLAEGFSSNPIATADAIVVGPTNADFGSAPGRVVALDPHDGQVRWTFFVVPQDERDPAFATWQPTAPSWRWGIGGASAWNLGAYDPLSETVIYGTGQPTPTERLDQRRRNDGPASADHYSSGFVALDANDGSLRWFHQVVPGDEWEYDQHTVPVVADVEIDGTSRRVAILATTTGFVVVVDVFDGTFLTAHRLVPDTTVHLGYERDGTPVIDDAMRYLGERSAAQVCPGSRWAHVAPGAFSPETGLLYRPNDIVCERQGVRPTVVGADVDALGDVWLQSRPRLQDDYYDRWGALSAIDPVSGEVVWEFISSYPHDAGVLATAGGLVFSAFADRAFRAFDAETGEVLFEQVLTSHGEGSPISYAVDGVQYVAVLVGHDSGVEGLPGAGLPRSVAGPAVLFVFALDGAAPSR